MNYQNLAKLAENAAQIAGKHALSLLGKAKIDYKPGKHIVTQADQQCQKIIIDTISQQYPHHGFIGEEGSKGHLYKQSPTQGESIWWIIDPIDGTRNFAHGVPQFCVSIAVMKDGMPIVGVIYDPNTKMLFSTHTDAPATCNGSPIRCSNNSLNSNSQIGLTSRCPAEFLPAFSALNKQCIGMYLGSAALHLAYVALGAYDATFTWEVSLWDIAAGAIIATNAGATLTNFDTTSVFPINCETYNGQKTPLVVGGKKVHAHLIDMFLKS